MNARAAAMPPHGGARTRARFIAALLIGSCAAAHAQEDVPVIEVGAGDLEARMARVERMMENRGLLDLANQVESLQREVQRLRGELEQQQHLVNELTAKQGQNRGRMDERLQTLEGATPPVPAAGGVAGVQPPATTDPTAGTAPPLQTEGAEPGAPPPPTAGAEQTNNPATTPPGGAPADTPPTQQTAAAAPASLENPDEAYSAAFNALKAGEYDDAIAQFNNFLVSYPDSPRADSAQYWLGEAHYVSKQYDPAINEYQKLVAAFPTSPKVSQAMLKIGFCQQELGQRDQARTTLQEVVQRYPGTTSARMAEDRLQRMRLEQAP